MKIFIDADACPVIDITLKLAGQYNCECVLVCDTSHIINRDGAKTVTVDTASDSADLKIVNMINKGDAVITGDYGLAAMCISTCAFVINHNGMIYNRDNIDNLLFTRYIGKKIRNSGKHLKGPSKRTADMDNSFKSTLEKLLFTYSYIQRNYILHVDIIENFERGLIDVIDYNNHGVLLYNKNSKDYLLSSDDVCSVQTLLKGRKFDVIVLYECEQKDELLKTVQEITGLKDMSPTYRYIYQKNEMLDTGNALVMRRVNTEEMPIIIENYHLESEETLYKINESGNLWIAFDKENKPVGFIGCHLDGSIGLLEIFPEFRQKGYATALEGYAVNKRLEAGFVPFCNVITNNEKSMGLQRKLGFTKGEGTVTWLFNR